MWSRLPAEVCLNVSGGEYMMEESETGKQEPEFTGHPRGTLAILIIYGVLFALGFFALYYFEFLPRGAPHP